jgi:hypothetical protein
MPVITHDTPGSPEVIYHHDTEARAPAAISKQDEITNVAITGGSSLEVIGGAGAVVLAIIALAGFLPLYLTSIACIAIGGALLAHGASVAARWNDTISRMGSTMERTEVAGGLGSEVLGGCAGIVLGILALVGVMPMVLLSVAAIVLGASVLFAAPAEPPIARFASDRDRKIGRLTFQAVEASSGTMVLAGVGAAVLGILALLRVGPPLVLSVVAMLALGGAVLLAGGALTTRFARRIEQS